MTIDGLLARFKIKTKVFLLVAPFVASISAVGLTGFYASGILVERMVVSNSVLQMLSGYKELNGALDVFLEHATEENRRNVDKHLGAQAGVLSATLAQLEPVTVGIDALRAASIGTNEIASIVKKASALEQRQGETLKSILATRQDLVALRLNLSNKVTEIEETIRSQDADAKIAQRDVEKLTKAREQVLSLQVDATENSAAVAESMSKLKRSEASILRALPESSRTPAKYGIQLILRAAEAVALAPSSEALQLRRAQSEATEALGQILLEASISKMREASAKFAQLDSKSVRVRSYLEDTRRLDGDMTALALAESEFRANLSDDALSKVVAQVSHLHGTIDAFERSTGLVEGDQSVVGSAATLVDRLASSATTLRSLVRQRKDISADSQTTIDHIWLNLTRFADLQKDAAGVDKNQANSISLTATITGLLMSLLGGMALVVALQRPIGQVTGLMRKIADGNLDIAVAGQSRRDEVGDIARALGVFKENALAKNRVEAEAGEERVRADIDRKTRENEKALLDEQIDLVICELARTLQVLATGDLSVKIDTPFEGRLDSLRLDFNSAVERLQTAMINVLRNSQHIQQSGTSLLRASDELSRRTESQAASLEQTAAAVDQITVAVQSSAARASEANKAVSKMKYQADSSAIVVVEAIAAMNRIELTSSRIANIIGVIDEIAFQTNLLALNAGIEAARAGEAGKGFAVVAQEVRELAQRSASAAREINQLISSSTEEVTSGSRLVSETGTVLQAISEQVVQISQYVDAISTSSRDQASALLEVNGSVNQMDQMTQENAAAASHSTQACRDLQAEADALVTLIGRFQLSGPIRSAIQAAA